MKTYKVPVEVIFEGTVEVKAPNKQEARRAVKLNFGGIIDRFWDGGNDKIIDWNMGVHASNCNAGDKVEIITKKLTK